MLAWRFSAIPWGIARRGSLGSLRLRSGQALRFAKALAQDDNLSEARLKLCPPQPKQQVPRLAQETRSLGMTALEGTGGRGRPPHTSSTADSSPSSSRLRRDYGRLGMTIHRGRYGSAKAEPLQNRVQSFFLGFAKKFKCTSSFVGFFAMKSTCLPSLCCELHFGWLLYSFLSVELDSCSSHSYTSKQNTDNFTSSRSCYHTTCICNSCRCGP